MSDDGSDDGSSAGSRGSELIHPPGLSKPPIKEDANDHQMNEWLPLMKQVTSNSEMEASDRKVCDAGCALQLYNATADPCHGRRMGQQCGGGMLWWWCTSTEDGGWRAQGQKVWKEDTAPQLPPWGEPPRRDRGKSPRREGRKRGGKKQHDPYYGLFMAHQARNKGRGKGRPSDDARF